jgi:hypothetical protein
MIANQRLPAWQWSAFKISPIPAHSHSNQSPL